MSMTPRSIGTPDLASNVASRLDLTGGRQDALARHHVVSRSYLHSMSFVARRHVLLQPPRYRLRAFH